MKQLNNGNLKLKKQKKIKQKEENITKKLPLISNAKLFCKWNSLYKIQNSIIENHHYGLDKKDILGYSVLIEPMAEIS